MAGGVIRGLVAGLALGLAAVALVSVLTAPDRSDATAATQPEPVVIERTYGPPSSELPRLWSPSAPARPATPQAER